MTDLVLPDYEATVSEELTHLLRGSQEPGEAKAAATPPANPEPPPPAPVRPARSGPWRDVALRRDGRRPFRFRGMLLMEETARQADHAPQGGASGSRCFSVFATEDGRVVAHLAFEPPEDLAARPVYRAAELSGQDDLIRFLSETGPETCFAVDPFNATPLGRKAFVDALCLPREIPGLAPSSSDSG